MPDLTGQSFGRYRILERLGEGGMATVYKATDTRLDSSVAIKVISIEKLVPQALGKTLKRFEREAKALAQLTHPNIVKVMDYGEWEGQPFLVMPYLPGGTLKAKMGKPINYRDAARLLVPIAQALDYAHENNLIHRDVKPSNILLTDKGQPLLSDFGIARIIEDDNTIDLTGTRGIVGTPEYMSPEQGLGKTIDQRSDIYSLGIVFYEMVTGKVPFQVNDTTTPMEVIHKHAFEPLPPPTRYVATLPKQIEQVLLKALAKKPDDRYQTMAEFGAAMQNLLAVTNGKDKAVILPSFSRKTWLWMGGSLLVVFIGLGMARMVMTASTGAGFAPVRSTEVPSIDTQTTGSVIDTTATKAINPIKTKSIAPQPPSATSTSVIATPVPSNGSASVSEKDGMPMIFVDDGTGDAFWIDQTAVTGQMYKKFVEETGYVTQVEETGVGNVIQYIQVTAAWTPGQEGAAPQWSLVNGVNWKYPDFSNADLTKPVVQITWVDASAYCDWAGRQMVESSSVWERAAKLSKMVIYSGQGYWSALAEWSIDPGSGQYKKLIILSNGYDYLNPFPERGWASNRSANVITFRCMSWP